MLKSLLNKCKNFYLFSNVKNDCFGGLTAAVVALPLALAFGVASGLGAAAGLYGAIILGFFAALFGGTPTQISGPTGPITVVAATIVAAHINNPAIIFATIILAGFMQIFFGITRIGSLIKYVPYPVVSGFMSGIGVIIIFLQIEPLFGLSSSGNTIKVLTNLGHTISSANLYSILIGLLTIGIVFFTPKKISKIVPVPLIALVGVTVINVLLNTGIPTIGTIPSMLPQFVIPAIPFAEVPNILKVAFALAILASIDSLLTSLVADSLTKTKHNSNKELIGQGIGNMLVGFFGGLLGSGATMRTVINIKSGAKTSLSGMIHAITLLLILVCVGPLASQIPMAVLAGILIKVGIDIIDYKFLKLITRAPKHDTTIMFVVFFITVFYDLIFAVEVGIVLSTFLLAVCLAKYSNLIIEDVDGKYNIMREIPSISKNQIKIINIHGVLFFGSISRIFSHMNECLATKCVVINCSNVPEMDISAIFSLEEIIAQLNEKGIDTILVLSNRKYARKLIRMGLLKYIKRQNVCCNIDLGLQKAYQHVEYEVEWKKIA